MRVVNKDCLSAAKRSWNMSRIRGKDTTPEKIVRSVLHRMGLRFRLHRKIEVRMKKAEGRIEKPLVVRPDIVLAKYKTAIFVHGC